MDDRTKLALCAAAALFALGSLVTWVRIEFFGEPADHAFIWVEGEPPELAQDEVEREPAPERVAETVTAAPERPRVVELAPGITATYDTDGVAAGRVRFVVRTDRDLATERGRPAWLWATRHAWPDGDGGGDGDGDGDATGRRAFVQQLGRRTGSTWTFEVGLDAEVARSTLSWSVWLGAGLTVRDFGGELTLDFMEAAHLMEVDHFEGGTLVEVDLAPLDRARLSAPRDPAVLAHHLRSAPALWGEGDGLFVADAWTDRWLWLTSGRGWAQDRYEGALATERLVDLGSLTLDSDLPEGPVRFGWGGEAFAAGRRAIHDYEVHLHTRRDDEGRVAWFDVEVEIEPDISTPVRALEREIRIDGLPESVEEVHVVGYGRVLLHGEPSCWRHAVPVERDASGSARATFRFDRLALVVPERVMLWAEGVQPQFVDGDEFFVRGPDVRSWRVTPGSGGAVVGRYRRSGFDTATHGAPQAPAAGFRVRAYRGETEDDGTFPWRNLAPGGRLTALGWREVAIPEALPSPNGVVPGPAFGAATLELVEPEVAVIDGETNAVEASFRDAGPGVVELEVVER